MLAFRPRPAPAPAPAPMTSSHLHVPRAPIRRPSLRLHTPPDEIDEFLSSDLELSFASTMSLHSPPRQAALLTPGTESPMAMDISPAPQRPAVFDRHLAPPKMSRPRSHTSGARLFGRDLSNATPVDTSSVSKAGSTTNRKMARPGLPFEWLSPSEPKRDMVSYADQPMPPSPASSDAMDVDSFHHGTSAPQPSSPLSSAPTITAFRDIAAPWSAAPTITAFESGISGRSSPFSAVPFSAAPTVTAFDTGYNDLSSPYAASPTVTAFDRLFFETTSPGLGFSHDSPSGPAPKKRRSLSRERVPRALEAEFLEAAPSSPVERKLRRMASGSLLSKFTQAQTDSTAAQPALDPSPVLNANKRPRRPALSTLHVPSSGPATSYTGLGIDCGDLGSGAGPRLPSMAGRLPPARRAVSAMMPLPPTTLGADVSSDEASFDNGPEMSSPAQAYAARQQLRTIRRCDGTEDFRPLAGASAMRARDVRESPSAKFMGPGMPGFGDNEAHGKILPCHRVKEDGLMRVSPHTLNQLLDGAYDSRITEFHVIDCRFDYEYSGGHVPGAININTTVGVEEFLLGGGISRPRPCSSADASKKTVLVFHCEFSAKRAPTFAKHLRSKDRSLNNHCYPKIHYPEVYILEGGYCRYFGESAVRCQPAGYIRMDDPVHAAARKEDLDQFRKAKFGRTKSYAYGEGGAAGGKMAQILAQAAAKRNTAPGGGSTAVFAAANAARTRRTAAPAGSGSGGGNGDGGKGNLVMLQEDGAPSDGDEDTDIGDSPCPPPSKAFGLNFKVKKMARAPLMRAETCGPMRLAY